MNRRSFALGTAISLPAGFVAFHGTAAAQPASPDAELIRLCDAYTAAIDVYNTSCSGLDYEDDPSWHALQALEAQLEGLAATTFEGLLAKARVAHHQAQMPDGSENYSDSFTGDWPAQVIRDLLAMAEGGPV